MALTAFSSGKMISTLWPDEALRGGAGLEVRYRSLLSVAPGGQVLRRDWLVPECAPELWPGVAAALGRWHALPVIRTVALADDWRHWARVLRVGAPARLAHTVDFHLLVMELTRHGLGVVLVCRMLVAADIAAGRLVMPCRGEVAAQEGHIVGPEAPDGQQVLNLRRFLMGCAQTDPRDILATGAV